MEPSTGAGMSIGRTIKFSTRGAMFMAAIVVVWAHSPVIAAGNPFMDGNNLPPAAQVPVSASPFLTAPITNSAVNHQPDTTPAQSDGAAHGGIVQQWGDSLDTDLYDSDRLHARLKYYGSNRQGDQAGVGISLTFPQ